MAVSVSKLAILVGLAQARPEINVGALQLGFTSRVRRHGDSRARQ